MITIRSAISADARAIAHVQIEGWQSTYRGLVPDECLDAMSHEKHTAQWEEILDKPNQILFVADDETAGVVGFASAGPERTGRTDYRGELYAIYVLQPMHGRGIGKQLFRRVARSLLDTRIDDVIVWVLADNPFRQFYEALEGKLVDQKEIEISGHKLVEVAYGWDDLQQLKWSKRH